MRIIGEDEAEKLYQGWHDTLYDSVYRDSKMSVEKFYDGGAHLYRNCSHYNPGPFVQPMD